MSVESLDKDSDQESMADAERKAADKAIRRVYQLVEDAMPSIGGRDVAASVCGIDSGDLTRAFNRSGRYLAVDHIVRFGARLRRYNATVTAQLASAIVHPMDLLVFPRVTLSDKERADRCELALKMLGPLGEQALAQALGQEPVALGVRR